ncbi:DUF928 domain-containing protein [Chroococcus sp. FPU101]|uniref:DUF928 domain-containing protein n=1 Tax=Chroococcus sp. FPU101 TaxID=1974212 RepID=UPI001A8C0A15|nr:DUF928 domain-containing protein [Chroococcus sp. FPU101]GFE70783.1 protein of unknown function DUF928 [Chroococcus sp. FPU101]
MHTKSILSISLGVFLSLSNVVWAGYVPPAKQEPPSDYSSSTGIRSGCPNQEINSEMLVILAPQTYVGETTSVRPQFTWWTAVPSDLDFRLFEFTANGQVKQKGNPISIKSSAGINQLSLPTEHPPLTVGQKYLWQVALRCPNGNYVLERAEFKVVTAPSNINPNLNSSEKVKQYAQDGFWYDALSESLQESSGKLGKLGSDLISSLAMSENLLISAL